MSEERVERVRRIAAAALEKKAEEVTALDVREVASFADTFLFASGGSDRQVRTIADAILEAARGWGEKALGVEGYDDGRWVLIDLTDVIVHVFRRDVREHYDLERLWSDAPRVDLGPEAARSAAS